MRRWVVVSAVVITCLVWALPAQAITGGTPDGNGHPNVGAMLAAWDAEEPGVIKPVCSGTLISPTIYLTAGHCAAFLESLGIANDEVWVSFASEWTPSSPRLHGVWHTHPEFGHDFSDYKDLAVIVLDQSVTGVTPAALPTAGLLDQMRADGTLQNATFTNVGYGSLEKQRGVDDKFPTDFVRKVSTSTFQTLTKSWLKLSQKLSQGDGGNCYGDSGGPQFLGTSNMIVSITTTGDSACYASNVDYRVDTAVARAFLDDYVTVP